MLVRVSPTQFTLAFGIGSFLCISFACLSAVAAEGPTAVAGAASAEWHTDYGKAWKRADATGKMLLVWFRGKHPSTLRDQVDRAFARNRAVRSKLGNYVLLRLPTDAKIVSGGAPVRLLSHAAYAEMHGNEGLVIVDLADKNRATYGRVVSAFPFMQGKFYRFRPDYLAVILDLPPGTITERTMIWAVRIHPERPQSTNGEKSPVLDQEAQSSSLHQAQIGVQGHHRWDGRFHRIRRLLGGFFAPVEVVAESWPGQTMIDSAIDCVDCWRQSSGHWQAVRNSHTYYGYDIKRGRNGIWYGTGIFSGRWR
jgi:hypothetical protein